MFYCLSEKQSNVYEYSHTFHFCIKCFFFFLEFVNLMYENIVPLFEFEIFWLLVQLKIIICVWAVYQVFFFPLTCLFVDFNRVFFLLICRSSI